MSKYMTIEDCASAVRRGHLYVREAIKTNLLKATLQGGNRWLVAEEDFQRWVKSGAGRKPKGAKARAGGPA